MYNNFLKPIFDKFFALFLGIILLPLYFLIIVILLIFNHRQIFFIQKRIGKHGKDFKIIKFKTMKDVGDNADNLLPDEKRLTKIGTFLRKTSLDELPQLINILKGEMSFIGPRPLLPEYLTLYSPEQALRHTIKPGITGWAQINGRNNTTWQKRFNLDVWYVQHLSLFLDIKIFLLTIVKIFKREGISGMGTATMEKFTGNN